MRSLLVLFLCLAASSASDEDIQKFITSTQLFGDAVYNEILLDNTDNILVSPFSVEAVLALTQSGAFGTTAQEIRSSLFLPDTEEELEAEIKSVLPTIQSDVFTLKTANKIYVENRFPVKKSFQTVATDVYQADFQSIEFLEAESAAAEINQWVEEETDNKIHDLVNPEDLSESTVLILLNALFFQANFTFPFNPPLTRKSTFYLSEDQEVEADAMFLEAAELNFYESGALDAQILELPFNGPDASLTIVLPNKKEGIAVLEKQIPAVFSTPEYRKQFVQVLLPKFRIESTIDFVPVLEKLGVHAAFDSLQADLSGIAGNPGDIVISAVKQKSFIDVNEIGVTAAAVTDAIVGITSVVPPIQHVFNADHPFIFYIKVHGLILFEGRVLEPKY